ncbi:UDP-Glycosyltransferase/glycogen phosphorylase [Wilcoxina mikolae CBS 423.85]|nr:UDP-Glycosyltransferase/glycogen phosphorylase [Wilcoxina mikolae CBS 423.85]
MAPSIVEESYSFGSQPSTERRRSFALQSLDDAWSGISLVDLFIGASAKKVDSGCIEIAPGETIGMAIKAAIRTSITHFSEEHHGKFIGAGITKSVIQLCPDIASFLWRELDIIVMAFDVLEIAPVNSDLEPKDGEIFEFSVDEQADSAVRKAIMYFGPQNMPPPSIGFRNKVEVDIGGIIQLVQSLDDYSKTVSPETWKTVLHYASALKKKKVKIAFFSATPQGGGVALMRHALIRYFRLLGIQAQWFIPKPSPAVFRITKTNHNILQGVAAPDARFTAEKQEKYTEWITCNARRYWLSRGGPLAEGGADVVVIDDPQMPGLIPLIKQTRPDVKIIYRSHIEIRSDLATEPGSPQEEVWRFLWERIKLADVFISHPVNGFVPKDVPANMVALMPAATDWLDGLNKTMRDWDLRYYHHKFRIQCHELGMPNLSYPARNYIAQIARFDPSKGIPTVLESYRKLRRLYAEKMPDASTPQLLICGHGAIDDPDSSIIFDKTVQHIDREEFDDIREDIVVMRVGPSDQLLNALLSTAKIVLQLSSREGFEVKVSEALHKGKPVIATRAGGIPLQVQDGKNGFLVKVGDSDAVAEKAFMLLNEERKWKEMSEYAKRSVSDEVGTVGNALCWMYLAQKLAGGETVKGYERWVADMAREEAGVPWKEGETRLPRGGLQVSQGHRA